MPKTVFAMITLMDDGSFSPVDPGYGNRPIHHPGHPDHGLPGRPDHIGGGPIYHPGHPDHGLPSQPGHPSQGLPSGGHIGNQLPWAPGHPDQGLPVPPGVTPPQVPANLREQVVVLWHLPGQVEWHGKVIDPSLVAGMPLPTPPPTAGTPLPPTPEPKK